jgi:hypothetical protein
MSLGAQALRNGDMTKPEPRTIVIDEGQDSKSFRWDLVYMRGDAVYMSEAKKQLFLGGLSAIDMMALDVIDPCSIAPKVRAPDY